jgi:hypothetical protein
MGECLVLETVETKFDDAIRSCVCTRKESAERPMETDPDGRLTAPK